MRLVRFFLFKKKKYERLRKIQKITNTLRVQRLPLGLCPEKVANCHQSN